MIEYIQIKPIFTIVEIFIFYVQNLLKAIEIFDFEKIGKFAVFLAAKIFLLT